MRNGNDEMRNGNEEMRLSLEKLTTYMHGHLHAWPPTCMARKCNTVCQ